jgi:hypothetical protein
MLQIRAESFINTQLFHRYSPRSSFHAKSEASDAKGKGAKKRIRTELAEKKREFVIPDWLLFSVISARNNTSTAGSI